LFSRNRRVNFFAPSWSTGARRFAVLALLVLTAPFGGRSSGISTGVVIISAAGGGSSAVPTPVVFYQGGTGLAAGQTLYGSASTSCTIKGWSIQSDTGTATIKVWKVAAGSSNPTSANSINTSGVSLASGNFISSTTLTDFTTTTVTAGDLFGFNLFSVTSATQVVFTLTCS
jgi:hypothetical protein